MPQRLRCLLGIIWSTVSAPEFSTRRCRCCQFQISQIYNNRLTSLPCFEWRVLCIEPEVCFPSRALQGELPFRWGRGWSFRFRSSRAWPAHHMMIQVENSSPILHHLNKFRTGRFQPSHTTVEAHFILSPWSYSKVSLRRLLYIILAGNGVQILTLTFSMQNYMTSFCTLVQC